MQSISAFLLVVCFAATAHGLGAFVNPLPPARYGPPGFISKGTSRLFNPNQTTGTSPLFDLLNTVTFQFYKPIAKAIDLAFFNNTGLGNALNYLTANIFGGGLCAFPPATTQTPMTWPGMPTAQGSGTNNPTSAPTSIIDTIKNIIGGVTGGAGNPGSAGTPGKGLLGWLMPNSGSSSSSSNSSTSNSIISTIIQKLLPTSASNSGSGTGSSGGSTGNSPLPTIPSAPQISLEDLAKNLSCNPTDLQTALNAANLTPSQLSQLLSSLKETHDQFHNEIVNQMNNIGAAIQNLLTKAAQQAIPAVHSLANALNTSVANLLVSALQSGCPVSALNTIMKTLNLPLSDYLKIFNTACQQNYPCFFQQLLSLYANALASLSGNGGSNGNGLGDTVTNGLNGLGAALGPLGGTVTNLLGGLLHTVNGLVSSLLGGLLNG